MKDLIEKLKNIVKEYEEFVLEEYDKPKTEPECTCQCVGSHTALDGICTTCGKRIGEPIKTEPECTCEQVGVLGLPRVKESMLNPDCPIHSKEYCSCGFPQSDPPHEHDSKENQIERCIVRNHLGTLTYTRGQGNFNPHIHRLHEALSDPDFIGYEYEGIGRFTVATRQGFRTTLDEPAEIPVAVLFKRGE